MSHYLVNQLIHVMWSTQNLQYHIHKSLKNDLNAYVTALVKSKNGRVLATGGSPDHIHLLIVLPPEISLSTLLGHVKAYSSKWIKSRENVDPKFSWQEGYLAISTQEDKLNSICQYIKEDENRHQTKNYRDEIITILNLQGIKFNKDYLLTTSFSKVYVHLIWSTHNRTPCLEKNIRQNLYTQMTSRITNSKGIVHEIGGIEDHVHVLMEIPKNIALSDFTREIKTAASHWLKAQSKKFQQFEWQAGYGGFTVSHSNVETVKKYIQNQEEHHREHTNNPEWENFFMDRISIRDKTGNLAVPSGLD